MDITLPTLYYGAEPWANTLKVKNRCKLITSVQRTAALRVASAYKTVSGPAVQVITGTIPIDLLALERRRLCELKKKQIDQQQMKVVIQEIRQQTLGQWQERREHRSRWTAKLIIDVRTWSSRNFGEVDYYVTKMLPGRGNNRRLLKTINMERHPEAIPTATGLLATAQLSCIRHFSSSPTNKKKKLIQDMIKYAVGITGRTINLPENLFLENSESRPIFIRHRLTTQLPLNNHSIALSLQSRTCEFGDVPTSQIGEILSRFQISIRQP